MFPVTAGGRTPSVDPAPLVLSSLSKSFPGVDRPSVRSLSLDIAPHEILGLVGLNGAGKTTTIRLSAGVILPTAGSVTVSGFDIVREKSDASRHLGWVPEFPNFDPFSKAPSLLRYFAGFRGLTGPEAARSGSNLLGIVGLADSRDRRFGSYSQGMKKRFALAVAMLGDPEVMLLDEVLNGLDVEGITLVRRLMVTWRGEGKAILLSSHLLSEVQQVADRVAILHHGRLVRILSRQEIKDAGSNVLRITVTNLDAGAVSLLATKGTLRRDGETVWLSEPTAEADEINLDLVRRGYHVKELAMESGRLEDLFFELIDGSQPEDLGGTPGE